jgi:hypothetical protein
VSPRTWGRAQVRETLEPLLDKNRPAWMADLSLHTFTLGDTPPHVSAVKARHRCMLMSGADGRAYAAPCHQRVGRKRRSDLALV